MKFATIWSLRGMSFKERLHRTRDWSAQSIGAKLPLRVRYWVTLQEIGKATTTSKDIPATPLDEILRNLNTPKNLS